MPMLQSTLVHRALRQAERRSWRHLGKERIAGRTTALPLGKRFWPISNIERKAIEALFESDPMQQYATQLSHRHSAANVTVIDAS